MNATFPCPNAGCPYQFDARQLPAAAMVTCPMCRTRFAYRDGKILPQGPSAAAASAKTAGGEANETAVQFAAGAAIARTPVGPSTGGTAKTVLIIVGVVATISVTILSLYMMVNRNPLDATGGGGSKLVQDDSLNLSFQQPGKDWITDSDAYVKLEVNIFCLKHSNPDAWVAIAAKDYKDRSPRPQESELELRKRLKKFFRNPEMEAKPNADKTLGGKPARYYVFTGESDGTQMTGDALIAEYKGILYLSIAWGPSETIKDSTDEIADIRGRFSILKMRERWTEQKQIVRTFFLKDGKYSVSDDEDIWIGRTADQTNFTGNTKDTYIDPPKEIDPKATIALRAKMKIQAAKSKGIDFIPQADALVLELDRTSDPMAALKAHLKARIAHEDEVSESKTILEDAKPANPETVIPTAEAKIALFTSRDPMTEGANKFFVLSALNAGGKTIGVIAECNSKDAKLMETDMVKLAGSLATR